MSVEFHVWYLAVLHILLQIALSVRVLLRPRRDPASRLAWLAVILVAPIVGMLAYLLFGETNVGNRRVAGFRKTLTELPPPGTIGVKGVGAETEIPARYAGVFGTAQAINGFHPTGGNDAHLMADSDAAIDRIVADIDAAKHHVHVSFYIWLPDGNGCKVVEALKRAAARGITCRAMADDLGSREIVRAPQWEDMAQAGVRLVRTLKIGNPLLRPFIGRIDLRNHRKIVVIDNWITYVGSQNCADPAFLPKAKFAPWVDAMMRFTGPIARQNQFIFASDWMTHTDEDLSDLLTAPMETPAAGFPAQAVGTGPTEPVSALTELILALMFSAREELIITTPYYVPDEEIQAGLCAAARRGVRTTFILPERNDSRLVAAASRSYYPDLIEAGVHIHEYVGGLLHTKSLTVDGELTLIGSANLDRRSFELNFENNILFWDRDTTAEIVQRQHDYLASAVAIKANDVRDFGWHQRLWHNAVAMFGPLL
ncbi:MAG: cardiolipin synthase [Cereibacter sphaeroides]|uniref:Cardiolipin synthase n=1 Tax=Cereibacter sphaeroides TaxID=1063 RepID=A0A2W5SLM5_CERSP|nr:MAG: cardiolipin synthase [Cereibacter sphaeroides]